MRIDEVLSELRTLREALTDSLNGIHFYAYTKAGAKIVLSSQNDWEKVAAKFKSTEKDVIDGVDCWALGHTTAAVFHFMRVAEIGLRALARERRVTIHRKPLEWANWQDILRELRVKIEKIAKRRAGPSRDAALEFYRGALGEFEAFKDAYRNNVMHVRVTYDEHQALSVMNHVREFMTRLASRIDEKPKAIRWGLR